MASLLSPFRRDRKRDFASGEGPGSLRSRVEQALMTEGETPRSSGELLWRTRFGSGLHLLRHRPNDDVLSELARVLVRDALAAWLPDVELTELEVTSRGAVLLLRLSVRQGRARATVEVSP